MGGNYSTTKGMYTMYEAVDIVTFADVERRGETMTGPMLMEKRWRFEEKLEVPDSERLKGAGWVPSFCKA